MKVLATELIVAIHDPLRPSFVAGLKRSTLCKQLEEMEAGTLLTGYGIRNAIEQDFFGWYTDSWSRDLEAAIWNFATVWTSYDVGTFQVQPDACATY